MISPTARIRRTSRRLLTVAVAATCGAGLASCATAKGGADSSSAPSFAGTSASLPSTPVQIMGFGGEDEIGSTRLELAKAAIAPATVTLVKGDLDVQQFLSAVASGKPPELVYANRDQVGTLASRGAIVALDDCIKAESITTDDFVPAALDQVRFDGKVYGIPEFNSVQITMANANLLKAAGKTLSDVDGSDWAKVTEAATAMSKSPGGKLSVIGYDSKMPEFLPLWAKANGADLLSSDGKKAQLNDPKVVEALSWAVGIYTKQGGFPKVKATRDAADFFGKGNQFATSTLGAMPMEQWYLNVLSDVSPTAPMAFTSVKARDGKSLAYASGSAWAIPKNTKNPQAACRFAKVMTETDSWMKAAKARVDKRAAEGKLFTGLLTGNKTADQKIRDEYVKGGKAPWSEGIAAMYDANEHTFALPANPAGEEFSTAFKDAVNRVLNGQAQPQASLDQAQEQAQKALDKAWSTWDKR